MSKIQISLLVAVLFSGIGQIVQADLAAIGGVDPITGFPAFVQDANNGQLGPCDRIDPVNEEGMIVNNAPCPGTELENPLGQFVEGNILEFTYYRAEANIVAGTPNGERFRLRMEVQGGVLPPESINNAIRLRLRNLVNTGLYIVTTPFGQFDINVTQDDIDMGGIDIELPGGGLGQTPDFNAARSGNIMCFWSHATAPITVNGQQFLSDGIVESQLIPVANNPNCPQTAADLIFSVQIPSGTGVAGTATTDLFSVEGRLLDEVGIVIDRATYERNPTGNLVRADIWVRSIAGQNIVVTAGSAQLRNASGARTMLEDATDPGIYFLRQRLDETTVAVPPNPISLSIGSQLVMLVDEVRVTRANHNVNTDAVDIRASSSDLFGAPALTALDQDGNTLGTLVGGILSLDVNTNTEVVVPPNAALNAIRVESVAGGSDTEITNLLGGNVFK